VPSGSWRYECGAVTYGPALAKGAVCSTGQPQEHPGDPGDRNQHLAPNDQNGSGPLADCVPCESEGGSWPGAALATGAKTSAPPIAAAANHGATCLIVLFMDFSNFGFADLAPLIVPAPQAGVVTADTHSNLLIAGTSHLLWPADHPRVHGNHRSQLGVCRKKVPNLYASKKPSAATGRGRPSSKHYRKRERESEAPH
jgi:hypothetical protein